MPDRHAHRRMGAGQYRPCPHANRHEHICVGGCLSDVARLCFENHAGACGIDNGRRCFGACQWRVRNRRATCRVVLFRFAGWKLGGARLARDLLPGD